jgi:tripartite-type tricarboxylate transporter receptor subunit TctC
MQMPGGFRLKFLLVVALALLPVAVLAQAYPERPVRFIVGFPPGSSIDVVSRIVLDDIRDRTGAVFVIENRPGALGAIGVLAVEKSAPDGYTLMPSSNATHSSGPHLLRALGDLEPAVHLSHVGRLVRFDIAIIASASGPYGSAKSLIDAARAQPNALTYGYGSGTGQVGAAAFSHAAHMQTRPISYKGQPAAISDLLAQRVDFVATDLGAVLAFVQQGSLRGIALMADKRSAIVPEIPTAAELGIGNAVLGGWIGVDAPPALPAPIRQWWVDQLQKSLASPAVQQKLHMIGMETAPLFGDEFKTFVDTEYRRWGEKAREAGIQAE